MKYLYIPIVAIALLPTLALANDYYWKIGQCQPGIQSEACDGKIVKLSLTDATHYGELKLINLPSSIEEALLYNSCKATIDRLVSDLRWYDTQNPFTSYNTDAGMIRNKNEERFNIVLNAESKITDCINKHHRAIASAEKEAEQKAAAELQAQKEAELLKQKQLEEERARKEKEEDEKRQREIDEAVAKALAEQATQQAQIAPKPTPIASPKPVSAPVAISELKESEEATETLDQPSLAEDEEMSEEVVIEPVQVLEPTPAPKQTLFQRIRNFFSRWF